MCLLGHPSPFLGSPCPYFIRHPSQCRCLPRPAPQSCPLPALGLRATPNDGQTSRHLFGTPPSRQLLPAQHRKGLFLMRCKQGGWRCRDPYSNADPPALPRCMAGHCMAFLSYGWKGLEHPRPLESRGVGFTPAWGLLCFLVPDSLP